VVTGKPIDLGGSLGRREATGRGVFTVAELACAHLGLPLSGARVAVQGLGNVGGVAARLFAQAGSCIVAVQDHTGTVHREAGLDLQALLAHVAEHGGVAGFSPAQSLPDETFWDTPSDILIPAALEQQITPERAARLHTRLIVEGANGPTTIQADDILAERNILVVPDVIANAGGVTVSYFEWVQDFSSFFWDEDEINRRLVRIMSEAFHAVWKVSEEKQVSLRTAAFIVACRRILHTRELRGLYP
jgi:glutamate dehydrogenase (NAD(P)+)